MNQQMVSCKQKRQSPAWSPLSTLSLERGRDGDLEEKEVVLDVFRHLYLEDCRGVFALMRHVRFCHRVKLNACRTSKRACSPWGLLITLALQRKHAEKREFERSQERRRAPSPPPLEESLSEALCSGCAERVGGSPIHLYVNFSSCLISNLFLFINHFLTHMGHELYTRYVTILEVIDPLKFYVHTHRIYKEFDENSERDSHSLGQTVQEDICGVSHKSMSSSPVSLG